MKSNADKKESVTFFGSLMVFGWSWGNHGVVIGTFPGSLVVFGWSWGSYGVVIGTFPGSVEVLGC